MKASHSGPLMQWLNIYLGTLSTNQLLFEQPSLPEYHCGRSLSLVDHSEPIS